MQKKLATVYPFTRSSSRHASKLALDEKPQEVDSDKTIIYDVPSDTKDTSPVKNCKRSKAMFKICTIGIKHHKDTSLVLKAKKRQFTCILCGFKAGSTKCLNEHFKNTHDSLKCMDCNKEYFSALSLKKNTCACIKVWTINVDTVIKNSHLNHSEATMRRYILIQLGMHVLTQAAPHPSAG